MSASFATMMYAFIALPLAAIVILNLLGKKLAGKLCFGVGLFVCIFQMITAVVSIALLVQFNKAAINFSQFWDMHVAADAAYFSIDFLSAIALLCIGMVGTASFATAASTVKDKLFNYTNMMMILVLGLNGIALVTDLFSVYVFLEITGIASYLLIALYRDPIGLEGAFKYLIMSTIASAFILLGCALLFLEFGSLRFAVLLEELQAATFADPILVWTAFLFLIAGFGIKGGSVPFHGWLPDAHGGAPSPVSIMLSGVVAQMSGTYAMMRLIDVFLTNRSSAINTALLLMALLSIVGGALAANGQNDLKRTLAYSSISQIGYIVLGISCGSTLGFIGAVFHFFNHSTFKSTLFANAAAIKKQLHSTDFADLGGLQKQMPVAGVTSIIAGLSTVGIPPFAGFWSKLLIIIAVWQAQGPLAAGVALCASIFTAVYFLRIQHKVFFGPEDQHPEVRESRDGIAVSSIALSVVTVLSGLLFPVLLLALQAQGML